MGDAVVGDGGSVKADNAAAIFAFWEEMQPGIFADPAG
jgi:hypothetical protein